MKTKYLFYLLIALSMFTIGCKKKEKEEAIEPTPVPTGNFPELLISDADSITESSAVFTTNIYIIKDNVSKITAKGICWSHLGEADINGPHTSDGTDTNSFKSKITGLYPNVDYKVRPYATNSAGTDYGSYVTFKTKKSGLSIGDSYQGGIIAYIFQLGDIGYIAGQTHGIIASTYDQSTGMPWTNGAYPSIPTSKAIGTGNANTNSIVSIQGSGNYAGKLCADLVIGGYSDWYLPSKDELDEMYNNKDLIGGFAYEFYWSSTQDDINYSWGQDFGSGFQDSSRSYTWRVRAVRTF
jgi:hypothetical protein